jgi:hypothetical protein
MEGEIQTKNYFGLQVKCPSLLTDLKKKPTAWSACMSRPRCNVLVTSPQWKVRYRRKTTLQFISAHYLTAPCDFLPGTTITQQSTPAQLCTVAFVFPPRHYHYTAVYPCPTVYCGLCVSSQALPLHSSLPLLTVYCGLCVSSQALPLYSSLPLPHCVLWPLCFLPGTTIMLESISHH